MTEAEGVAEIEAARWEKDDVGCLNLIVHDSNGHKVLAWLTMRPHYCDRGHMQLSIEGIHDLDVADSFPRYFFSFAEADTHTRTFLKWRLWKVRTHPHEFGPVTQPDSVPR